MAKVASYIVPDVDRRLWSADVFSLCWVLTKTRLGDRSSAVADPRMWNIVPASLHLLDSYVRFKSALNLIV